MIASASRHLADVALRMRTLFRRLGSGLDGPGSFGDADAWYCILEGTEQTAVAEAQARALVDLLASFAVRGPVRRDILLAVDEFSAVSRRLPIWQLLERARSLGLAVQISAQSWTGLGATEDERSRIAAVAEGGIWLMQTPQPEPLTALAGTRKAIETARALGRFGVWSRRGMSRLHEVPVADPALVRRFDGGQVAYIYRGGVTYIQVKQLVVAPEAIAAGPHAPPGAQAAAAATDLAAADEAGCEAAGHRTAAPGGAGASPLPDASPLLDAAFGPEPR
jgi:hypothetical protein